MEENVINLRKEVWLIPPNAPIKAFIIIIKIIKFLLK